MDLPDEKLSEREVEILARLANGLTDQQIAESLFLSLNTVKWYNRQIYSKLGVNSRTQAIVRARELQLIEGSIQAEAPAPLAGPTAIQHLPADLTSFIGRKRESTEIKQLLAQNRLVTLVGPPGAGKTRLSLQVAREMAGSFRDGVYFVPLAPVQGIENILWAITDQLDFPLESHSQPLKQLLIHLREKTLLFVFDNFDHLIAGGGLLTEILQAAPAVKILVTSRERLSLYGEVSYMIEGLGLPEGAQAEETAEAEAIILFAERAKAVNPGIVWPPGDLRHVARICRLVEGLPLGIELAATWLDTLMLEEIADEIEHDIDILGVERQDVPLSQRSIRAAFDWSWGLLDEPQRAALRKLSVFRGGLTRDAGKEVAEIGLRTLQALVNKSLIRHNASSGRYDIHEILRYYAEEQLKIAGETEAVQQAHAAYYAQLMADRWTRLKDHRQKAALQEIQADLDNIRAAWRYWIKLGNAAQLRKFFHTFWAIYDIHGWYPAGIDLFEQGIQVMQADSSEDAQACLGWLLAAQGLFSVPVGDYEEHKDNSPQELRLATHGLYITIGVGPERGFSLAQNGVRILKRLGKFKEMMIIPLMSLFITASQNPEEHAVSRQAAVDCLELATEIGDRWAIAKANQFLAVMAIDEGEYERAGRMAHQALIAFEANGDFWSTSVLYIEVLGLLAITLRQFENAKEWILRGLNAAQEIDFKYSIQTAYWQLGFVAALEENYPEAGQYWHKALAVSDRMLGGRSFIGFGNRRQDIERGGRKRITG